MLAPNIEPNADGPLAEEDVLRAAHTFRETGIVVLDDIYDPTWVAGLHKSYKQLIEAYLADRGGIDALDGKTFGKNHIGIHPALFTPWGDADIVAHPKTSQVMAAVLGPDFQSGYYHSNAAYPGSELQPIHRDTIHLFPAAEMNVPTPCVSLVLNIPLCDFTLANGSTEVWPGSHLILDRDAADTSRDRLAQRAGHLPSLRTNVRAGSVILRDLRCWHRGMPNTSDHVRPMLALVYERGWKKKPTLDIPASTWESWPESARHIFRDNRIVPDAEAQRPYRLTQSGQLVK